MANVWRCRKVTKGVKCGTLNLRVKQKCSTCGGPRPKRKQPAHRAVLSEMPYEQWVARYGEVCGICGREPTAKRRLDRDHCHGSGEPRGLLCARCNRALPSWVTTEWLLDAAAYVLQARLVASREEGAA